MSFPEVLQNWESEMKNRAKKESWGHLAPEKDKEYKCSFIFGVSHYFSYESFIINSLFKGLDDSPWLFRAMETFIFEQDEMDRLKPGFIYQFTGIFKNYVFSGEFKIYSDCNQVLSESLK